MDEPTEVYTNSEHPAAVEPGFRPPASVRDDNGEDDDRRRFLELLFGDVEGYIDIRFIEADGPTDRIPVESIDAALTAIENHRGECNVYVGIATRKTGGTAPGDGGKKNLAATRALWVDLDFEVKDDERDAEVALRDFPHPPTMIVNSGNGLHAYWSLCEPYPLTALKEIERFEVVLKGVTEQLDGDRAPTDASRVLRVPGTTNYPNKKKRSMGRSPVPCTLVSLDSTRRYTLDDFESFEEMGRAVRSQYSSYLK